jgi:ABC-type proline/glycine betaine transport system permease subunit
MVPIGMSTAIFCQTFGGTVFLSLAQTVFTQGLIEAVPVLAPGISLETVINAGASAIATAVPPNSLGGVILAYNQAISHAFYLGAGAAVATFTFCWGMGWKSVKKTKTLASEARS